MWDSVAAVMSSNARSARPPNAVAALLWDLDNVTTRSNDLPRLARALARLTGPHALLTAAGRRPMYRAARAPLSALGFTVLSGAKRTNGADKALLEHAALLHRRHGVCHFVVASNDHAFTCLPIGTYLTVATPTPEHASQRLLAAANQVIVVDLRADHPPVSACPLCRPSQAPDVPQC